jgi:hypothetical protein
MLNLTNQKKASGIGHRTHVKFSFAKTAAATRESKRFSSCSRCLYVYNSTWITLWLLVKFFTSNIA